MYTSLPNLCANLAHTSNDSGSPNGERSEPLFFTQDKDIPSKTNEPELRRDFKDFVRRMELKWYFRNELTSSIKEPTSFTPSLHGNHQKVAPA